MGGLDERRGKAMHRPTTLAGQPGGRSRSKGGRSAPFVVGVPVSGDHFVGRRDILCRIDILVAGAQEGAINHMLLLGHRRMGKSSILHSAGERLAGKPRVVPVVVDAAGVPTRQRFAEMCMRAVLRAYAGKTGDMQLPERVRKAVGGGLKESGDAAAAIEESVSEYVRFGTMFSEASTDEDDLVEHALNYPEALGAGSGMLFVVMIDEFQDLLAWGTPFLSTLRRIIQAQKSVTYILAGSPPPAMLDMAYSPHAPFYRQLHDMHVPPLAESEVSRFVQGRLGAAGIGVKQGALDQIYSLSCGFPDYVQRLGLASLERCAARGGRAVGAPDIGDAYSDMLVQIRPRFEAQFARLSPMEREVLVAIARSRNGAASMSRAVRAPMSSLPRALGRLVRKGLAEKHVEHRYRITDPVFADWIAGRYGDGLP